VVTQVHSGSAELTAVTAVAATDMTETTDFRAGGDFLVAIAGNCFCGTAIPGWLHLGANRG